MKKITCIVALLAIMCSNAQSFEWLKTPLINIDLNTSYTGYPTTSDPDGNVYIVGLKENPMPQTEQLGTLFYIKYNSAGEEIFNKTITGDAGAYSIAADSQGNVVMILGFYNQINIGNVNIIGDITEITDMRFALIKFDPSGNLIWQHRLFTSESEFNNVADARSIAFDTQDNIYIGYDNYRNSYITKYDTDGNALLTISQTGAARITSVAVDNAGNIYASGACANALTVFNGTPTEIINDYNIYAVKYSSEGVTQWVKNLPDITCPEPHIIARSPNEVYFSSYLFDDYDFDNISSQGPSVFAEDFFLARLSAVGEYQWVREVPGDGAATQGKRNFLALDVQGNVYFAGQTGGTVHWTDAITTSQQEWSSRNALVLKYSSQGNLLNAISVGGTGYNRADAVTISPTGSIYTSGIANSSISFGNITHEADMFYSYPFLTKINADTMSANGQDFNKPVVYPNPATSAIYFESNNPVSGSIYNTIGQKVQDFSKATTTNSVDISALAKGAYLIKTTNNQSLKFIKK
ncbi:T9SS type A sorting domain-containing protein [Flavobacterium sp. Sd200]|uniref:T9SS type A sorting domain-containing protein n=1 Tax=Flavobacterium sp. Sd200 TaxID=2692211 RepID=UPI00136930AD|nr:T9SS type A sorting domain-containing protein [Flavobacterium sp. Sd200]MXN90321.1 T9SS type A sorting domain-containing protein [Flavobacterium sp. Sd200]